MFLELSSAYLGCYVIILWFNPNMHNSELWLTLALPSPDTDKTRLLRFGHKCPAASLRGAIRGQNSIWLKVCYISFKLQSLWFDYHIEAETKWPPFSRRHFQMDENAWISIKISLKFLPRGPINNIPTLVQVMAWRRPGDKPLSEPMMVRLPTHKFVTRPQWVISCWLYSTRLDMYSMFCRKINADDITVAR